jgi:alpha-glucoside transport system substrate-binding protein
MIRSRTATLLAGLAVTATALSGGAAGVLAQSPAAGTAVVGVPSVPTGYSELDTALGADQPYKGKKVTIQTQWIGGEGQNFQDAVAAFESATGIDVSVEELNSGTHETLLDARIEGGLPLDLAMLAQPSKVLGYGKEGKLVDVATFMDPAKLKAEHPATVGLYSTGDQIWGVPYKVDVKSVVWYPIKAFAAAGYEVPKTWDELIALSDKIVADGNGSPWCVAIEAANATGWIATDWLEDVVLRTAGIDAYNKWITHDLKFDSPEIKAAMDKVGQILFTPGYVYGVTGGDTTYITATNQVQAMDPMFNEDMAKPQCWMQKQATWYGPDFFPDVKAGGPGTVSKYVLGEDVGLFYFPPIDPAQGTPALGAGDALIVIAPPDGSDLRPEVKAVAEFLSTPQGTETWIKAGSAISANQTTPAEWYADHYKLAIAADIVAKATSFGFDASDIMPAVVGAGSEWKQLTNWIIADGKNTDEVLKAIDASWPK